MTGYIIRAACAADVPILARWRAYSHVAQWWGDPSVEPPEEMVGKPLVSCWIVEHADRPLGFIQDYAVHDWSPHHFDYLPPGARGMDVFVGEPAQLGVGHGPRFIRQHVDELFRRGAPAVGIDPHPDNLAAQAAFRKAGFILRDGPMETRWGRAMLMDRRRQE